jgi:ABC-type transporter Mla MlaB component
MITHLLNSGVLKVIVSHDLVVPFVENLRKEIDSLLGEVNAEDWKTLELDLTATDRIDSLGLNLVIAVWNEVRKRNGRTAIIVREGNVQQSFCFTHLARQIDILVRQ